MKFEKGDLLLNVSNHYLSRYVFLNYTEDKTLCIVTTVSDFYKGCTYSHIRNPLFFIQSPKGLQFLHKVYTNQL